MSKIRIKNFGPIKEGYLEDDGWLDIKKVTVFIGNQGSGKSTVAKVFSTLSWMEKSINRGDIRREEISFKMFHDYFEYQGINSYFQPDTYIEYSGNKCHIKYDKKENLVIVELVKKKNYFVPKIMYIPAERNFLSTIKDAFEVKGLPEHLFTFAEELRKAQKQLKGKPIELPIHNYRYEYDELSESSFVLGPGHRVNLLQASSGFQSTIPLFLVSRHLTNLTPIKDIIIRENMSVTQSLRMNEEIVSIALNNSISDETKQKSIKKIQSKYINRCFINIVEEPEQNLFPSSQRFMLISLCSYNNRNVANKLIITTHSPFIISYLTLAVKAHFLKNKLSFESIYKLNGLKAKLSKIVPLGATIKPGDIAIYEFEEKTGTIKIRENYQDLPSDENKLNEMMEETNELFAQLLEIQQKI